MLVNGFDACAGQSVILNLIAELLFSDHPDEGDLWSMEKMQAYLCYVKTFSPEMTDPAARYVTY